jgi:inner membrane protein
MLTFVVYFFIELFQKKFVNAMQYVLIGFALCLFYTLLLSISEYTGYVQAYILSAAATILLISMYTKSVFGTLRAALVFGGFLSILYGFIFLLIQLEDGALLVGSIGLFIILASIMFISRKLDWNKIADPK